MIWHFLEVWLFLAIAFVAGCALGAYLYGLLAESRLALVQGAVADQIGDGLDRMKAAVGLGPAWRPHHLRSVARPLPALEPEPETDAPAETYIEPEEDRPQSPARREEPRFTERETLRAPAPEQDSRWDAPSEREVRPVELPTRETRRIAAPARAVARLPAPERVVRRPSAPERLLPPPEPEVIIEPIAGGDPTRLASASMIGDDGVVPMRPAGLSGPRGGVPDNLTRIRGVGERNEALLNSLGIYHFGQIASWTPGEARWIGQYLAFPERIDRDDWVGQAMVFATGGDTGFEKSAERRRRRRLERKQSEQGQNMPFDEAANRLMPPTQGEDDDEDGLER